MLKILINVKFKARNNFIRVFQLVTSIGSSYEKMTTISIGTANFVPYPIVPGTEILRLGGFLGSYDFIFYILLIAIKLPFTSFSFTLCVNKVQSNS